MKRTDNILAFSELMLLSKYSNLASKELLEKFSLKTEKHSTHFLNGIKPNNKQTSTLSYAYTFGILIPANKTLFPRTRKQPSNEKFTNIFDLKLPSDRALRHRFAGFILSP